MKFSKGEIVIYMGKCEGPRALKPGDEVELGEFRKDYYPGEDYWETTARSRNGNLVCVRESVLRKRRPPEQYKDQFTPCDKDFNWRNPGTLPIIKVARDLESTMRLAQQNLAQFTGEGNGA